MLGATTIPQMSLISNPGRIFEPTLNLRWFIADQFNPGRQLQQLWICRETGEVDWKLIPEVSA